MDARRLLAALVLTGLASHGANAQAQSHTANAVLPNCRNYLETQNMTEPFLQGYCVGLVEGVAFGAPDICLPGGVTRGQLIRVVVRYIEERPQRMHEHFIYLATEALFAAFPCKPSKR